MYKERDAKGRNYSFSTPQAEANPVRQIVCACPLPVLLRLPDVALSKVVYTTLPY